ncbi:MAG: FAD-binding oxidoreductase [Dehalococcoidia bacterium]
MAAADAPAVKAQDYKGISFWHDSVPEPLTPRPSLAGKIEADVAIVGAGFTGLWTAYYLKKLDSSLKVVVVEKEIAGFGASGRNGGWCSGLFPASWGRMARESTRELAVATQRALFATVDEVGRVAEEEEINCHYQKGGTISLARNEAQLAKARAAIEESRSWGFGEEDYRLLEQGEARSCLDASGTLAALYTPNCAAIHPARLVRGLADVAERMGVQLYERSAATTIAQRRVETASGSVESRFVIRATEGFTSGLPGESRTLLPIYSLMIATEPLPDSFFETVGLRRRETFGDLRYMIIYGQRTADNRIAFGGRGAPYHFGSKVRPEFDRDPRVHESLRSTLVDMFPALADVGVTHSWGGALGVPRDFFPSVSLDPATGLGWAGGYVGDGVSTSNMAGRTMAHLITGVDSELLRLPWVNHGWRRWEREPLRWLGFNAVIRSLGRADETEARTGKPSRPASWLGKLLGR